MSVSLLSVVVTCIPAWLAMLALLACPRFFFFLHFSCDFVGPFISKRYCWLSSCVLFSKLLFKMSRVYLILQQLVYLKSGFKKGEIERVFCILQQWFCSFPVLVNLFSEFYQQIAKFFIILLRAEHLVQYLKCNRTR